ncbi:MAG: hemolysin family protein [Pseudomonadota bacterium]
MSLLITYFLAAVVISFVCSLMEAVLLSLNHAHIALLIEQGRPSGKILERYKEKINLPLSAILTLNTVANTVGAAGVGAQAQEVFGSHMVAAASALLTLIILVFSEFIPKTLGAVYWKQLGPLVAHGIRVLIILTYPLVFLFQILGRLVAGKGRRFKVSREEIIMTADLGQAEGSLEERERKVIKNLLRLRSVYVYEIMTPRSVLFALPKTMTVGEVLVKTPNIQFSRIPVFGENLDDIVGLVFRFQINRAFSQGVAGKTLAELAHPIKVVPESKTAADVLDEFITSREHLFLVVDEYGGTSGIITLEDAIETLLGVEIVDELDTVEDMQKYALERWRTRKKSQGL